jgi:rSAM/selenodomain-associated transferase 2
MIVVYSLGAQRQKIIRSEVADGRERPQGLDKPVKFRQCIFALRGVRDRAWVPVALRCAETAMGAINSSPPLSVVIPTLNASAELGAALAALEGGRELVREVIVADGGSTDATAALAQAYGAQFVVAPRGRGQQLAVGAGLAWGEWLCFLHADTRLEPGWPEAVLRFIADPANRTRAAYFRFRLDDDAPEARRLERLVERRCRILGLPYGDQALVIARKFYRDLGGFPPVPLMEDVALVRRIGKRRLVQIEAAALTSAARYRRDGYRRRSLRNLSCLVCYFLGVPPRLIQRIYG